MRRLSVLLGLALWWSALSPDISRAQNIYTFEPTLFTLGQTTPIPNAPPNIGSSAFRTSFTTDSGDPTGYQITNIHQSGVIVGQALIAPTSTSPLTLAFNSPVFQLSVDFAVNVPNSGIPIIGGFLQLITPVGTTEQYGANVGGIFEGGTLIFSSSLGFTTATLQGFAVSGVVGVVDITLDAVPATPTQIEIDNLSLTTVPIAAVPEPSTLALLASSLAGLAGLACGRGRRK